MAVTFKMTEQVEQWICIKFCIKLKHSSTETIQMIQKASAMGNWWLAASSQHACLCITSHAEVFGKTSNLPGDSAPLQPRFGALWLLAFPKTKIYLWKGRDFRPLMRFRKYNRASDGDWQNCVRSQVPTLKEIEASLSCVQCFLYLVSSQ